MSTHTLDASGQRTLTTSINDPARTTATVSAKQGDDAVVTLGAYERVEVVVPTTPGAVKLVKRVRATRVAKRDDKGEYVRDDRRQIIYEDGFEDSYVLVFTSYFSLSAHTTKGDVASTPHSTFRIVNLENDPNKPVWVQGEDESETVLDLGYGTEKPE